MRLRRASAARRDRRRARTCAGADRQAHRPRPPDRRRPPRQRRPAVCRDRSGRDRRHGGVDQAASTAPVRARRIRRRSVRHVALLDEIIAARCNLLVSGATSSGKTTFVAALLQRADPADRLVVCEDTAELTLGRPPRGAARGACGRRRRPRRGRPGGARSRRPPSAPRSPGRRRVPRHRGAGRGRGDEHRARRLALDVPRQLGRRRAASRRDAADAGRAGVAAGGDQAPGVALDRRRHPPRAARHRAPRDRRGRRGRGGRRRAERAAVWLTAAGRVGELTRRRARR